MAYIDKLAEITLGKKSYKKFPVILNKHHILNRLVLKYFLSHRIVWSENTLHTYSKHLCDFFSQLEVENPEASFDHINDVWLEAYAYQILERNQNSPVYISQILTTVIHFLVWCEDNGYCKNLIGPTSSFKIQIISDEDSVTHPLIKHFAKKKSPLKLAPKEEWISKVLAVNHFKSNRLETRFSLMVDWALKAGLRAHEVCALNIDQIPTRERIERSKIDKENLYIDLIVTKGGKRDSIPVNSDLLKRTRDYIDFERQEVIKKFRQKASLEKQIYDPAKEIFLSLKTGQALHPRTLSNQIKSAWHQAVKSGELTEDQHVWTHGLRHRFTTNQLKGFSKADHIRNPQQVVKLLTRHKHESTVDIYTARLHLEGEGIDE
ncbi:tyrosine recombinase XerC [Acinetobacter schindleri]